jgi:hypothetical protein
MEKRADAGRFFSLPRGADFEEKEGASAERIIARAFAACGLPVLAWVWGLL